MPNIFPSLIASVVAALLISCHRSQPETLRALDPGTSGVEVGNYNRPPSTRRAYMSSQHFELVYDPQRLRLVELGSDAHVRLDNAGHVPAEQVSYLDISVDPSRAIARPMSRSETRFELQQVRAQAKLIDGAVNRLELVRLNGAVGYVVRQRSGERVRLLITSRRQIVKLTDRSHHEGDGADAVAAVVNSLTFHVPPPVLRRISFSRSKVSQEDELNMELHITDSNSPLDLNIHGYMSHRRGFLVYRVPLWGEMERTSTAEHYRYRVPLNLATHTGNYELEGLRICNVAPSCSEYEVAWATQSAKFSMQYPMIRSYLLSSSFMTGVPIPTVTILTSAEETEHQLEPLITYY